MNFSPDTRFEIRMRAGNISELSGAVGRPLQCCHLNHDKDLEEYNTPDMGVLVTDIEHYAYHLLFKDYPSHVGLRVGQNNWALQSLWNNIVKFNRETGLTVDLKEELEKAKGYWFYYLGIEG
jgi:hypothetical protein